MELKTSNKAYIPCRGGLVAYMRDRVRVEAEDRDGDTILYTGIIIAISNTSDIFTLDTGDAYCGFNMNDVIAIDLVDRNQNNIDEDYKKQLEDAQAKVKELQKKIETYDRYKQYDEMADEMAAMKNAYVQAGFTKEEAFQLLMESIRAAATMMKKR